MYRTGKPFHGCATFFVFFLLYINAIATTFIFEVEGAKTPSTEREIEEAQKIVGRFLRNEAGSKWLSGLVKTNSAPLTAEDLTNAILNTTKPEGKVWQAASILRKALKSQTSRGIKSDAIMDQISNWKDLIADIEKEDDIICLYRKNTEQTAKRSEDWQKFLKTVTPGYTVHLAIDTGLKYVICLKKIEVPEVNATETSTSSVTLSSTVASTIPQEITTPKKSLQAASFEKLKTITPIAISTDKNNTKLNIKLEESGESCEGSGVEETEDNKPEDINNLNEFLKGHFEDDDNDFINHSLEDEDFKKKSMFEMDDFNEDLENYPYKFQTAGERIIPSMNRRSYFPFKTRQNRLNHLPLDTPRRSLSDYPRKVCECNGPIIVVVMPDRSVPLEYRPQYPPQLSAQRSFVPFRLPSIPRIPIPRPPFPWPPFNPPPPPNKFRQLSKLQNLGLPVRGYSTLIYKGGPQKMLSTTTHFTYTIPREKVKAKSAESKAIGQTTQDAIVTNKKYLDDRFIQQGPNSVLQEYPVIPSSGSSGMSGWKQMKETRKSDQNIHNKDMPIRGSSGMIEWNREMRTRNLIPNFHKTVIPISGSPQISQWNQIKGARNSDLNIRYTTIPIDGLSRLSQWNKIMPTGNSVANIRNTARTINERPQISSWAGHIKPARNILVSKAGIPDQSQYTKYRFLSRLQQQKKENLNRQSMINRIKSILASKRSISRSTAPFIQPGLSRSKQQSIMQTQPLMFGRSVQENSNMNQRFPLLLQLSPNQKIDRFDSQLRNKLRSEQMPFQIQSTNSQANFPAINNFLRTQERQLALLKSSIRNSALLTPGNKFYSPRNDGPFTVHDGPCMEHLRHQIPGYHPTSCANSCDKPIKLQIVVQGKVQEPLKFSVLTEPNQRLEIVESDTPMPHRSRAANRDTFMRPMTEKTKKEKIFQVAEIGQRFYDREEKTGKIEKEKSVMNSTSDKVEKLVNEESSSGGIGTEIMTTEEVTEISTMQEIGERILLDITTLPSSRLNESSTISTIKNSTIIADVASTMLTKTNSTIIA